MAKGLPGARLGKGSFFEVLEDGQVRLREAELNGRFCPEAPPPQALRTRYRLRPGTRCLRVRSFQEA
jgi:hypothetical protein